MATYRAIRNCFHNKFYYQIGGEYHPTAEELKNGLPDSFVKEKDFTSEAIEAAEIEDRGRQVFIQPLKAKDMTQINAAKDA
jgi:hypothetical protein